MFKDLSKYMLCFIGFPLLDQIAIPLGDVIDRPRHATPTIPLSHGWPVRVTYLQLRCLSLF